MGGAIVGATVADDGEQEGGEAAQAGAVGGDRFYQVIGTLKEPESAKPTWVTEIIQVSVYLLIQVFMPCKQLTSTFILNQHRQLDR